MIDFLLNMVIKICQRRELDYFFAVEHEDRYEEMYLLNGRNIEMYHVVKPGSDLNRYIELSKTIRKERGEKDD